MDTCRHPGQSTCHVNSCLQLAKPVDTGKTPRWKSQNVRYVFGSPPLGLGSWFLNGKLDDHGWFLQNWQYSQNQIRSPRMMLAPALLNKNFLSVYGTSCMFEGPEKLLCTCCVNLRTQKTPRSLLVTFPHFFPDAQGTKIFFKLLRPATSTRWLHSLWRGGEPLRI